MSTIATNRIDSSLEASPFHPSNLIRLRALKERLSDVDFSQRPAFHLVHDIYDLKDDWHRLEKEPQIGFYQTYSWCSAWQAHHKGEYLYITLQFGAQIEFILPLEIRSRFGVKTAHLIGNDHSNMNFALASSIFLQRCGSDFVDWFIDGVKALDLNVDVIALEQMRVSLNGHMNPFLTALTTVNHNASFQLPLLPSFEDTLRQLNAKRRRKKFRHSVRKLDAIGGYSYEIANSPAERNRALSAFYAQKSKRLLDKGLPDVFANENIQQFFEDISNLEEWEGAHLQLHMLKLKGVQHEGKILAVAAMMEKDGHALCQFSSFCEALAAETESSPGELLFHHMIENSVSRGANLFDFGIGDQPYKHSWCTVRTIQMDGYLPLTGLGHFMCAFMAIKTRLKAYIKSSDYLYKLASKLRSLGPILK